MGFEILPLDSIISEDETFRITFGAPSERLISSIKSVGILNPPWVRQYPQIPDKFQIVLGYSRLCVAQTLKFPSLICRIIEKDIPDADLLLANIYDNLSQRELNPIEQALALGKSLSLFEKNQVLSCIMPVIGLGESEQNLKRALSLLNLPPEIMSAVADGRITPSNAYNFLRLKTEEQLPLFNLFNALRLGVNLQKEFFENLYESSRRDGITINAIIEGEPFASILADEAKTAQERAMLFRAHLRHLRYPHLARTEDEFRDFVKSLKLPPEIVIKPPAYFEGDTYQASVRFRTSEEIVSRLEKIRSAFTTPAARTWFPHS